jgi:hypothetical protein
MLPNVDSILSLFPTNRKKDESQNDSNKSAHPQPRKKKVSNILKFGVLEREMSAEVGEGNYMGECVMDILQETGLDLFAEKRKEREREKGGKLKKIEEN